MSYCQMTAMHLVMNPGHTYRALYHMVPFKIQLPLGASMLCVAWLNISCIVSIEYNSKSTFTCACNTGIVACVSNLMMACVHGQLLFDNDNDNEITSVTARRLIRPLNPTQQVFWPMGMISKTSQHNCEITCTSTLPAAQAHNHP